MDLTKQELADLVGITYRQLYNINKKLSEEDEGKTLFVKGEDAKKCDLAIFIRRWVDYNVSRVSVDAEDLDAVKAQHETVKMRKTQLEVDRMEGSLVDVQDVRKLWGDIANTIMQTACPEALFEADQSDVCTTSINCKHRFSVIALGPGMGTSDETIDAVDHFLKNYRKPCLLDADALNIIHCDFRLFNSLKRNLRHAVANFAFGTGYRSFAGRARDNFIFFVNNARNDVGAAQVNSKSEHSKKLLTSRR